MLMKLFLLFSCYLKLGEWQSALHDPYQEPDSICTILHYYKCATDYDKNWYKVRKHMTLNYKEGFHLLCTYMCTCGHVELYIVVCHRPFSNPFLKKIQFGRINLI